MRIWNVHLIWKSTSITLQRYRYAHLGYQGSTHKFFCAINSAARNFAQCCSTLFAHHCKFLFFCSWNILDISVQHSPYSNLEHSLLFVCGTGTIGWFLRPPFFRDFGSFTCDLLEVDVDGMEPSSFSSSCSCWILGIIDLIQPRRKLLKKHIFDLSFSPKPEFLHRMKLISAILSWQSSG